MAITIGPKGWVDLFSTAEGPKRKLRILSIAQPAAPGDVNHQHADPAMQPLAMFNMKTGADISAYVSDTGAALGSVKVTDTGADLVRLGGATGDTLWVFYTDTGV